MKAYYDTNGDVILTDESINLDLPFITIETCNFIKPKVVNGELVEGATEQEIADLETEKQMAGLKSFIKQKKIDGEKFYEEIELSVTMLLAGLPIQSLVSVNNEINEKIMPLIKTIYGGNWFDVYMGFFVENTITPPTNTLILPYFEKIKTTTKNYFETNYPR